MTRQILLVEDDESIAEFVELGMRYEGFEVSVARTGDEALHVLRRGLAPELIVLDLTLPGASGMDVLAEVRRRGDVPVVILSARDQVSDRVKGLEAGADDYLTKPFRFEELLARVRAVLRRKSPDSSEVLRVADIVLDPAARDARRNGALLDLTAKEFDLLELLVVNRNRVLTRDILLDRVWGFDHFGESNVIEVHVSNLRRKLEEHGPRLVQTVRNVGYVLRPSAE